LPLENDHNLSPVLGFSYYIFFYPYFYFNVLNRDDNAGWPDPHKARTLRTGPPCPAQFMQAIITSLLRPALGLRAGPLFFILFLNYFLNFYDKTLNV